MEISLIGKTALIGGSTAGIGRAIAHVLARCGASVILLARNEEKLKATLKELDIEQGQEHQYLVTNFNDFENQKGKIAHFLEHRSIDILVNNTQGPAAGPVTTKDGDDYQDAFNLLFQHTVFISELIIPYMRAQGYGRIVNVSSMTVKEPSPNLILSNTMRTALLSWAKSLSVAVAADGITVNSVLTGAFDTDRLNSLMEQQAEQAGQPFIAVRDARIRKIPVGRLGDPLEFGYLVAFLASPYAAFLNGTAIPLDGGASVGIF